MATPGGGEVDGLDATGALSAGAMQGPGAGQQQHHLSLDAYRRKVGLFLFVSVARRSLC